MKKDLLDDDQSSVSKELCRCVQHTENLIKDNRGVKVVCGVVLREDENNRIA